MTRSAMRTSINRGSPEDRSGDRVGRMDYDAYRSAKPARAAWANALIVAALILISGFVIHAMSGFGAAVYFYVAAVIALLVAGILALTRLRHDV